MTDIIRQIPCPSCGVTLKLEITCDHEPTVEQLKKDIEWMRQTVHRAHHEGTLEDCRKNTCSYARKISTEKEK